ncbi:T9SS type A sorting domain-containing protein [Balneolales bacterium ANBcel1]|nr:T9SS type A sorting domain-containing protein [Balneolales bacterium ANBcel1]
MKHLYRAVPIHIVGLLSLAFLLTGSSIQYEVTGVLVDSDQTPLDGLSVMLFNEMDEQIASDETDSEGRFSLVYQLEPTSAEPQTGQELPSFFQLGSPYPNPFNPRSTVPFYAPQNTQANISLYNILGQSVLSRQVNINAGSHEIVIQLGGRLAQGQYILRVLGEGYALSESMTFLSTGIGSGSPEIRLQSGTQPTARIESNVQQTDNSDTFRVVVEESGQFSGKEISVTPMQNVNLGSLILSVHTTESCDDLTLLASSSMPAHMISLEGIPESLGDYPLGWLYDADYYQDHIETASTQTAGSPESENALRHPVYIEHHGDGEGQVLVPVHPANYMEGGDAVLVVKSGNDQIQCPALPLQVEALPPAAGTIEKMIIDIESALEEVASAYGKDPEMLRAEPLSDFDSHLWHIAAGLQMASGPNNPDNLRAILEGDSPFLEEQLPDEEILEVVDAIFAVTGIADNIGAISNDLKNNTVAFKSASSAAKANPVSLADVPQIRTPEELDAMLDTRQHIASMNEGLASEMRDITGLALGSVAVTTGAVGAAPVAAACGLSALAVSLMQLVIDLGENTLPSQLQALDLNASPTTYNEDNSDIGEWKATLEAVSNGFTLDTPTAIGFVPGMGKLTSILTNNNLIRNSTGYVTDNIVGIIQTHMTAIWDEPTGPVTIDPMSWVINIDPERDEAYFDWSLQTQTSEIGDDPFRFVENNDRHFYPNAVGTSYLRVRTSLGVFQDQFRESIEELVVRPIQVSLRRLPIDEIWFFPEDPPFYIRSDDEMDIRADVFNADDQTVSWEIFQDGFFTELGSNDVTYSPPDEPGTHVIIVRSQATGGARDNSNAPVRSATARVHVTQDELIVYPDLACLEMDDTHQFKAVFDGMPVDFSDLEWDMTGPGSVLPGGVYVPVVEGDVTMTFYHPDNPDDVQEISFTVRDICSYMTLSSIYFNHESNCLNFIDVPPDMEGVPIYGKLSNSMNDPFLFYLDIHGNVLQESGDWSGQIPWVPEGTEIHAPHWISIGLHEDGQLIPGIPRWIISESISAAGWPLGLERKTRTVNGEEVGAWYGSFLLPVFDHDLYVMTEGEVRRETVMRGEFSGVLPGQYGCFD